MDIIKSILFEMDPCSSAEILDYINSDLFYYRGYNNPKELNLSQITRRLNTISKNSNKIFKFECENGYKNRFGISKYQEYLASEPRYLKVYGYMERCMFCGMPVYVYQNKSHHFKYKCEKYPEQNIFKLIKVESLYAIISQHYVYGVLDDLQSCNLRLPGKNNNKSRKNILSELWLINEFTKENGLIDSEQLLTLKAEEYITLKTNLR
ncbi:MAG: hypothetical protein ACP6IY_19235 [Promethearchaeia archaeon]